MVPNGPILEDIKMSYETAIFEVPPKLIDNVEPFLEKLEKIKLKIVYFI